VLFVDDSELDVRALVEQLSGADVICEHRRVATAAALSDALASQEWDIAISEWELRYLDAAAVAAALRSRGLYVPLIVASTPPDEELAAEVMQGGRGTTSRKRRRFAWRW